MFAVIKCWFCDFDPRTEQREIDSLKMKIFVRNKPAVGAKNK